MFIAIFGKCIKENLSDRIGIQYQTNSDLPVTN
jgi:hypothetical protein